MNKELDNMKYAEAMKYRLKKDGIFILTSCNLTSKEMDDIFVNENLFQKKAEIKGYKTFTYGGVTG